MGHHAPEPPASVSLGQALLYWLKLGFIRATAANRVMRERFHDRPHRLDRA
jgi:hypothetical protein